MPAWISSKTTKVAVFSLSLVPLALLLVGFRSNTLGANPIEYITHDTGTWTLRFVLLTLTITPARRIFKQPNLIAFRRMLGLFAFFYGCLHLMTWVWLDKFFDAREMVDDVVKRRFITMGMFGFVLMVPLAITSTKGWIRRLGRNWARLHMLVYLAAVCAAIHFAWKVKVFTGDPVIYAVVLALLLAFRVVWQLRTASARVQRPVRSDVSR